VVPEPPSRLWWELDAYINGHSPSETIAYLEWVSDWEDVQQTQQRRALPAGVVSPDIDPRERLRGFLCRIRGRE